jgi:hypothetical protein
MRKLQTLHEFLMEGLADRCEAIGYLDVALEEYQEDGDTAFHMSPDALQKILSSDKAPHIDTLGTILNAF